MADGTRTDDIEIPEDASGVDLRETERAHNWMRRRDDKERRTAFSEMDDKVIVTSTDFQSSHTTGYCLVETGVRDTEVVFSSKIPTYPNWASALFIIR